MMLASLLATALLAGDYAAGAARKQLDAATARQKKLVVENERLEKDARRLDAEHTRLKTEVATRTTENAALMSELASRNKDRRTQPDEERTAFSEPKSSNLLRDKTLVSWVSLAHRDQRGGTAVTIEETQKMVDEFDGIVFGEAAPGRWFAGSSFGKRSPRNPETYATETASPEQTVSMAVVYAGNEVVMYRNGEVYASYTVPEQIAYDTASSLVVFGLRHRAAPDRACLAGSIDDARIYDRPLVADEIKRLKPNVPSAVRPMAWWTFEEGVIKDQMGCFPVTAATNAAVRGGRLILTGNDSYVICRGTEEEATGQTAIDGSPVCLTSRNYPMHHIMENDDRVVVIGTDASRKFGFRVVRGLADAEKVSLESSLRPGQYVTPVHDFVGVRPDDGTRSFKESATFRVVSGLADPKLVSFQSYNDPKKYLRHRGFTMKLEAGGGRVFRDDSTFNLTRDDKRRLSEVFLSDLPEQDVSVGWGTFGKNGSMGYQGLEIMVDGKRYSKGISMHPPPRGSATVEYDVPRNAERFMGKVSLNHSAVGFAGVVHFRVLDEKGRLLWRSKTSIKHPGDMEDVDISVLGVRRVTLAVDCLGESWSRHAIWLDPRFVITSKDE